MNIKNLVIIFSVFSSIFCVSEQMISGNQTLKHRAGVKGVPVERQQLLVDKKPGSTYSRGSELFSYIMRATSWFKGSKSVVKEDKAKEIEAEYSDVESESLSDVFGLFPLDKVLEDPEVLKLSRNVFIKNPDWSSPRMVIITLINQTNTMFTVEAWGEIDCNFKTLPAEYHPAELMKGMLLEITGKSPLVFVSLIFSFSVPGSSKAERHRLLVGFMLGKNGEPKIFTDFIGQRFGAPYKYKKLSPDNLNFQKYSDLVKTSATSKLSRSEMVREQMNDLAVVAKTYPKSREALHIADFHIAIIDYLTLLKKLSAKGIIPPLEELRKQSEFSQATASEEAECTEVTDITLAAGSSRPARLSESRESQL